MGPDLQAKETRLLSAVTTEAALENGEASAACVELQSVCSRVENSNNAQVREKSFSTLSLVETIEYNFMQREHSGGFPVAEDEVASMGSSVSARKSIERSCTDVEEAVEFETTFEERRPSSVEVCVDPGLEEAEGIAHAQLVTKINSTFDNGFAAAKNPDTVENSIGFANILDEYKSAKNKSPRGKMQRNFRTSNSKQPSRQSSSLNLTLTGMKAKRIDRFSVPSAASPRRPLSRDRAQRPRNQNVMKPLEDRLCTAQKTGRRRSQEGSQKSAATANSDKSSGNPRKPARRVNLLAAIKPCNLDEQKEKFFASNFTTNPQFEYRYPANEAVLSRYKNASSMYLDESTSILHRVLRRYGNYEKFEAATGGRLLSKTEIWNTVKRYLEREGFFGDIVVDISNDLLSRAAMTINGGRPTLSIRESSAREYWVEGLLRHEVGTHHLRFHNNRQQIWHNLNVRRQMELQPANPTEEGLASLHSVLMRKDPSLWRAAMLYYAAYKASRCSFAELFADLGRFLDSPEVRWDYCLRTKRGQTDTSKPGCFCKDQVYLNGILALLQRRKTLDFHMLCVLGKVSYDDVERLGERCNAEGTKIPSFMKDIAEYRRRLDYIVHMNGLEKFLEGGRGDMSSESCQ